jgi:hypothetical protein
LRYKWKLVHSKIDPGVIDGAGRIGIGLGIGRRQRSYLAPALVFSAAAAAIVLVFLLWPRTGVDSDGFAIRGPDEGDRASLPVRLLVYNVQADGTSALVGGEIHANDELAFAYENFAGMSRLVVFGVDDLGNIYWYHPAWEDNSKDPVAVALEKKPGIHELAEAISHDLKGGKMLIYGVFSDRPITVRQIESLVGSRDGEGWLPIKDAVQVKKQVRVRRQK